MKNIIISATLIVAASTPVFAYDLIDLGANVQPNAINNSGVVVGSMNTDQYPASAFSWSVDNGFQTLDGTSANKINDIGQIAGSTITGAFIVDGNSYRDWSGYGAFGINQTGKVAGYKVGTNRDQPRSLPYNPAIYNGSKWDVYDIAGVYPRGTQKGVYADRFILNSINNDGFSVGYKYRYGLAGSASILIDPNVTINDLSDVTYLPIPAGGKAADINNSNIIVGTTGSSSATVPATYTQAYMLDYNVNSLTILPVLPGGIHSAANDINESSQVVGSSEILVTSTKVNHAVLWEPADGKTTDLNDLATQGWTLVSATAINDNGDIVGTGFFNGEIHGFLLTTGTGSTLPPVQNQPPLAIPSADITSGKAPLTVNFDSSASIDVDGTITAYTWDFMNGTSSNEVSPSHVFTSPGRYRVVLKVTDDQGLQSKSIIKIVVKK